MDFPLVSVICTSYNHGEFIQQALDSVIGQSWRYLEIVIIDNASSDSSADRIHEWSLQNKDKLPIHCCFHSKPLNYCRSFNHALTMVKGKYVIDLSGDDVLLPEHISRAVRTLEVHREKIYFSNALLEQVGSGSLMAFYPVGASGETVENVASGNVYKEVVQRNFLCATTMVFPSEVLRKEGGYDETLSYEDFDIIVRLARNYDFVFDDHIGVKKRILKSSFSAHQYRVKKSVMLPSTVKVCRKIQQMNRSEDENKALASRIMYEVKHALASANFDAAVGLLSIADDLRISGLKYRLFRLWGKLRLDLSWLYPWLRKIR